MKRRTLSIIDGSNFYHGVKRLCPNLHLTNYDYRALVEKIIGRRMIKIIYCVGEIRKEKSNKKSLTLYSQQQSLFYNLSKHKVDIYKGFMLKSAGKYHEKGVDVRIAVEILKGALRDEYDECLLLDCFAVNKSKEFESMIHNHTQIRGNKVTDLFGHENELELFLIGKNLSYHTLLNIINSNIQHYHFLWLK